MPLHTSGRPPSCHVPAAELVVGGLRELLQQHRSARLDQIEAFRIATSAGTRDDAVLLQAAASATAVLSEIDEALARLDAGTYGACSCCGADVEPERLLTAPWTRQCARCAVAPQPLG